MPNLEALKIADAASGALTREQKRFNTLLRQIGQSRDALQAWSEAIAAYRSSHASLLQPLRDELRLVQRQWVVALAAQLESPPRTRAERETIEELVCQVAGELLAADADDAELQALFVRCRGSDFATEKAQGLEALKELAQDMTGVDLGEDADIADADDLFRHLHERLRQESEALQERRAAKAGKRAKTAAQLRREEQAQQAVQSLREVYRKLASALHPDRATDAAERESKTALMQQVNDAYARNDLLTLLELQLRIEQIDAGHMSRADPARVKHYNKVLSEQLEELRGELQRVEMSFCMDHGIGPGELPGPQALGKLLARQAADLRAGLAGLRQEVRSFADAAALKRWLKRQRQALREEAEGGFFF